MRIAFSLGKTIVKSPRKIGNLMYELHKANNDIYVLAESLYNSTSESQAAQDLRKLGVYPNEHYKQLIILSDMMQESVDLKKAQFCRDEIIDVLFEGSESAIKMVNDISVRTLCWLVKPTDWD